jgi:hypothetical protein
MVNASSQVFISATRSGYFFHFSQCMFRQVQSNGLVSDYASSDIALFIHSLAALAFVPVADVLIL